MKDCQGNEVVYFTKERAFKGRIIDKWEYENIVRRLIG